MKSKPPSQSAWWLVLIFLAGLVYLWPFLRYPAFNLIDDGASLRLSRDLINDFSQNGAREWTTLLVETQEGRFRPFYHIYFLIIYTLFGTVPIYFWLGQAAVLGTTLVLMSLFTWRVTGKRWLAAILSLAVLLFATTAENFYRLGTAEPKQALCLVAFFLWCYWVKQTGWNIKKMLVGIGVTWSALFFKETSITLVATYWLFWTWQVVLAKQRSREAMLYGLTVGLLASAYFFLLPGKTGYNATFGFQWRNMWLRYVYSWDYHSVMYLSFLACWVAMMVRFFWQVAEWARSRTSRAFDFDDYLWVSLLSVQAGLILIIGILPWEWPLGRYFYPLYVLAALCVGVEVTHWYRLSQQLKHRSLGHQLSLASAALIFAILLGQTIPRRASELSLEWANIKFRLLVARLDIAAAWELLALVMTALIIRLVVRWWRGGFTWQKHRSELVWPAWLLGAIGVSLFCLSIIWTQQGFYVYFVPTLLILIFAYQELQNWKGWFDHGPDFDRPATKLRVLLPSLLILFLVGSKLRATVFQNWGYASDFFRPFKKEIKSTKDVAQFSFDTYQISYGAIRYVTDTVPPNMHIYIFDSGYEVVFEIGLFASHYRQQPVTVFTFIPNLVTDLGRDYPYLAYHPDPVTGYALDDQPKILLARQGDWQAMAATISGQVQPLSPQFNFGTIPSKYFWQVTF